MNIKYRATNAMQMAVSYNPILIIARVLLAAAK